MLLSTFGFHCQLEKIDWWKEHSVKHSLQLQSVAGNRITCYVWSRKHSLHRLWSCSFKTIVFALCCTIITTVLLHLLAAVKPQYSVKLWIQNVFVHVMITKHIMYAAPVGFWKTGHLLINRDQSWKGHHLNFINQLPTSFNKINQHQFIFY